MTTRRETSLVVGGTALVAATYGLARFGYGLFLPEIRGEVAVGPAAAGLVQAGGFVSYCLAALVSLRVGSRPRLLVVAAMTTAGVGSVVVALAGHVAVLATGVLVAGAGAGFASPALVALLTRGVRPARRDEGQVVVNAGTGVGIVAAAGLLLVFGEHWRTAWVVVALVVVLAGSTVLLADGPVPSRVAGGGDADRRWPPGLARPGVAALLAGAASAATWTFGPTLLAEAGGGVDAVAAWTAIGAGGVLGAAASRLSDWWGVERAWRLTTAVAGLATVLLGWGAAHLLPALVAAGLFGASYTALSGVLIVWATRVAPERPAAGTAVLFVALALGQALGAALVGALGAVSLAGVFVAAGLLGVLAALPAGLPARPAAPVRGGSSTPRRGPRRAAPR